MIIKAAMAANPIHIERNPRVMLSAPSEGPTVRSSMMSMGAASAPARSSSATSLASRVDMRPLI